MRLFVALSPPADVVDELHALTAALRSDAPDLRWTRPEHWHLTLAFLGEVQPQRLDELHQRLARTARRHPPLRLSFGQGGRFGGRVLWCRVHGDRTELRRLAESVSAAARRTGLPTEQRPYRPHLTLARAGDPADLRPLVERLAGFRGAPWVADTLHLMRSHLGAGPDRTSRYEITGSWLLGAGSAVSPAGESPPEGRT